MSWSLNKDKAKERFLKTYRRERDKKLLELDVEYMKALESTDTSEQTSIVSQKNTLRDLRHRNDKKYATDIKVVLVYQK